MNDEIMLSLYRLFGEKDLETVKEMISEWSKQTLLRTKDIVEEVAWIASKRGPDFILSCANLQEVFEKDLKLNLNEKDLKLNLNV
ncbi:hypothetical protein [Paenibacillus hubeiensis]|uniref:hypothetical protein n=1 Tax=Paenibacillus hubeiensis TaxID=3077330 RepID=UPI0031BB045A